MGGFGRRWTSSAQQSDIDSDYRRDMATNGVHQEARGRDGGVFETLRTRSRGSRRDVAGDASPMGGRSSSSAREEERRKVLEMEAQHQAGRRVAGGPVSRSASRVSRLGPPQSGGVVVRTRPLSDDRDSQYSGHSSSSAMRGREPPPRQAASSVGGVGSRFDQNRLNKVKRSTSNATASAGARIINRKKLPGSVTSSCPRSKETDRPEYNRRVRFKAGR